MNEQRRSRWGIFRGWHGQESFWREVYARTFATLISAFTIVVVGVVTGLIKVHANQAWRIGLLLVLIPLLIITYKVAFIVLLGVTVGHNYSKSSNRAVLSLLAILLLLLVVTVVTFYSLVQTFV